MSDASKPATREDVEGAIRAAEQRTAERIRESETATSHEIAAAAAHTANVVLERTSHEIAAAAAHTANVVMERTSHEIAAAAKAVMEYNRELFRLATDKTNAFDDRVTAVETRVDSHLADETRHRAVKRRRASR